LSPIRQVSSAPAESIRKYSPVVALSRHRPLRLHDTRAPDTHSPASHGRHRYPTSVFEPAPIPRSGQALDRNVPCRGQPTGAGHPRVEATPVGSRERVPRPVTHPLLERDLREGRAEQMTGTREPSLLVSTWIGQKFSEGQSTASGDVVQQRGRWHGDLDLLHPRSLGRNHREKLFERYGDRGYTSANQQNWVRQLLSSNVEMRRQATERTRPWLPPRPTKFNERWALA
jgi:hypothetical protein